VALAQRGEEGVERRAVENVEIRERMRDVPDRRELEGLGRLCRVELLAVLLPDLNFADLDGPEGDLADANAGLRR